MNPEAIMTPGGIADQLTRGLSGLGQSFARREELRYQGQRDRMADDRYTAEMALRQQAQERADARMALEDRRYGEQQARLGRMDQLALEDRQRAQEEATYRRNMGFLDRGVVPEGVREFKDPNPQEAFGRFGPNDPPPEWGEGVRQYTPEAQIAANARQALTKKMEPKPQRDFEGELATKIRATSERDAARARAKRMEQITKEINNAKKDKEQRITAALLAEGMTLGEQDGWFTSRDTALKNIAAARKAHESEPDPALQDLEMELAALKAMGGAAGALGGSSQPQPTGGDWKQRTVQGMSAPNSGFSQFVTP
jgi:hypothetical protein